MSEGKCLQRHRPEEEEEEEEEEEDPPYA